MSEPASPSIASRRRPRQARSTQLVADILEAAARVLAKEGAHRFTTARVAETAGVSVGSLYQYFPNKAALLFRLQSDEWQQTGAMLRAILEDREMPPPQRLRALVIAFVRSECAEAEMRLALDDAAPYYRGAPEAQASHATGIDAFRAFLHEALPDAPHKARDLVADLVLMALTDVGKSISERHAGAADAYAEALADMLCGYLERVGTGGGRQRPQQSLGAEIGPEQHAGTARAQQRAGRRLPLAEQRNFRRRQQQPAFQTGKSGDPADRTDDV